MRPRTLFILASTILGLPATAFPPDPVPEARKAIQEQRYDDAVKALAAYTAGNRFDGSGWSRYSYALHMAGNLEGSIEAGKKAIELGYAPEIEMFSLACAYALQGKKDEALQWLKRSFENRFAEQESLVSEEDLKSLRDDPRFIELTGLNPPEEKNPAKRWAWDLDFLARRMEQMHWNLYAKISKERFHAEIAALKSAAATGLSEDRLRVRISRLLAKIGDGHTTQSAFAGDQKSVSRIPLHFQIFSDGVFVIGAPSNHSDLVGAQLLKVGSMPIEEVREQLKQFCSVDNDMGYLYAVPPRLTSVAALQEIGAVTGDQVDYTFRVPGGSTRSVTVAPEDITRDSLGRSSLFRPAYVYANAKSDLPLYMKDLEKPLTLEWLEEQKAVYFGFHAVAENPNQPFQEFIASMEKMFEEKRAENLIIDMRLNGGGNTGLVQPLLDALIRNTKIGRPGHLFIIIGRNTFSAAQNTVNMIETFTRATFVGEPTGSRPCFVGESTYIVMPYSKIRINCSSRYWQVIVSTDRRNWVQPQIAAELSFQDFAENRDPCMGAIQKRISSVAEQPPSTAQR